MTGTGAKYDNKHLVMLKIYIFSSASRSRSYGSSMLNSQHVPVLLKFQW